MSRQHTKHTAPQDPINQPLALTCLPTLLSTCSPINTVTHSDLFSVSFNSVCTRTLLPHPPGPSTRTDRFLFTAFTISFSLASRDGVTTTYTAPGARIRVGSGGVNVWSLVIRKYATKIRADPKCIHAKLLHCKTLNTFFRQHVYFHILSSWGTHVRHCPTKLSYD